MARATEARDRPERRGGAVAIAVARLLAARAIEATGVVVALASLVFFALRLLPGDPARLVLGDEASPADLARVRAALHLDEPLWAQYARFLRGLATLDLGDSFRRPGTAAMARVGAALGPTSELAVFAVLVGAALGVAAAVLACGPWLPPRGRAWVERALVAVAAAPLLAFAPVVTWALAARWRVVPLPGDPEAGALGLAFAGGLLALPLAAHVGRVTRAALADVARAPFLSVASAKGAGPARVWWLHALPTVVGPVTAVVATQLGALLGGAVVLERMFERRGLGTLILEAYATRDLPVLEGAVVASGLLFVLAQAMGTLVHVAVDPRARAKPGEAP
jgi:peptide/nickel transport system permease protein